MMDKSWYPNCTIARHPFIISSVECKIGNRKNYEWTSDNQIQVTDIYQSAAQSQKALILMCAVTIPENVTALHPGQQWANNLFSYLFGSVAAFQAASSTLHLQFLKVCPISTRLQQSYQKTQYKSYTLWICSRTRSRSVETVHTKNEMKHCRSIKSSFCLQPPLLPCSPHPSPL